jgi:microcystin-dependent protein
MGGNENHILDITEMPLHNHYVNIRVGGDWDASNPIWGINAGFTQNNRTATTWSSTHMQTSYRGGNPDNVNLDYDTPVDKLPKTKPHNNMPPFFALAYIIKL